MKDITPNDQPNNNKIFVKKNKVYKILRKGKVYGPDWFRKNNRSKSIDDFRKN